MRYLSLIVLLLVTTLTASCRRGAERRNVTIATTPDVAATGIVETLASSFRAQRQSEATLVVTEARSIPTLVDDGLVDVVVTTSPGLRAQLERMNTIALSNTFATEEFVIVGPRSDPAKIRNAASAGEALRRIIRRERAFCSPIDVPDLREREAIMWTTARAKPSDDPRYRRCPGNAAAVLKETSARTGYTITDRGTFESLREDVRLEVLFSGEPPLVDRYQVLLVADPSRNKNALWFVQWVMSVRVRGIISGQRFDGERRLLVPGAS